MAADTEGGVKAFSASSMDALEDGINQFLVGQGTNEDREKRVTSLQFTITGGTYYALIAYEVK